MEDWLKPLDSESLPEKVLEIKYSWPLNFFIFFTMGYSLAHLDLDPPVGCSGHKSCRGRRTGQEGLREVWVWTQAVNFCQRLISTICEIRYARSNKMLETDC